MGVLQLQQQNVAAAAYTEYSFQVPPGVMQLTLVLRPGGHLRPDHCSQRLLCRQALPRSPRRIRFRDPETGKNLVFLTNQFALPALTICVLYRCRWQVELFFKWIKQHLRIKRFYGTSANAVR